MVSINPITHLSKRIAALLTTAMLATPLACSAAPSAVNEDQDKQVNAPTTAAAVPPIPELERWEEQMVVYGNKWGPTLNPATTSIEIREDNAYYDALYVYYRIMDYTDEKEPWLTYAGWARQTYIEEHYHRPAYDMLGHHRFSLGMLEDFERGDPTAKAAQPVAGATPLTLDDFKGIRDKGPFGQPYHFDDRYCGSCSNTSRELAYITVATIASERAGLSRVGHNDFRKGWEPRLKTYVRWIGQQMEQWRNASYIKRGYQPDDRYHYMQPFMAGLSMKALIDFYEWEVENNRDPNAYWEDPTPDGSWPTIVDAIAEFCTWLFNDAKVRNAGNTPPEYVGLQLWDDASAGFRYADRYTPYEGEGKDPGVVTAQPDLNLLIAPAYAWVYKETGDIDFLEMGDTIFAQGVREASPHFGSKQFNQQYFYAFDYVRWRSAKEAR